MPWITKEGRTVEEAKDAAVAAAGLPVDELEIEVVSEGAKGLFGLGGEPAVVRVRARSEASDVRHAFRDDITPAPAPQDRPSGRPSEQDRPSGRPSEQDRPSGRPSEQDRPFEPEPAPPAVAEREPARPARIEAEPDEPVGEKLSLSEQQEQAAALGEEIVRGILERMGLEGDVNTRIAGGTVYVEVFGEEMGILIGRGGATLEALQELVRAGVQRRLKTRQALVVDVEAYWERRRTTRRRDDGGERRRGRGERRGNGNRSGNR